MEIEDCGIWTDGQGFRAIEAYPSAAKRSPCFMKRLEGRLNLVRDDKNDALICAMVARMFETELDKLERPGPEIPGSEGWIWFPKLSFNTNLYKSISTYTKNLV